MDYIAFGHEQIRTALYGDQSVSPEELQILHTRTFQRLYDIKQLGYADRVYPDAIHSRFNHSLGALEQVSRIADWTYFNCAREAERTNSTLYRDFAECIVANRPVVRLAALLHDIFHIPFGHTLEDELHVFPKRHDEDQERKIRLLNYVLAEILLWTHDSIYGPHLPNGGDADEFWRAYDSYISVNSVIRPYYKRLNQYNGIFPDWSLPLTEFLENYGKACEMLLFMGEHRLYVSDGRLLTWKNQEAPLATELLGKDYFFNPDTEMFLCDMVGNTISADLLDYVRRDSFHSGLHLQYDERILQHFTLVKYSADVEEIAEDGTAAKKNHQQQRVAINIVKNRIRYDALSEILQILKMRYLLTERVLYHRTKCSASAMLAKAIQLIDLSGKELERVFFFGDAEFIGWLVKRAEEKSRELDPRVAGAINVLSVLRARRYYKPIFHIKAIQGLEPTEESHPATLLKEVSAREWIESEMEKRLGLEPGTILIYCPAKAPLKQAKCLVVYSGHDEVKPFNEVSTDGELGAFVEEAKAIEKNYNLIWNLYVFVPERYVPLYPIIEDLFPDVFREYLEKEDLEPTAYPALTNDHYLQSYLAKHLAALKLEKIPSLLKAITEKPGRQCLKGVLDSVTRQENEESLFEDSPLSTWGQRFEEQLRRVCEQSQ